MQQGNGSSFRHKENHNRETEARSVFFLRIFDFTGRSKNTDETNKIRALKVCDYYFLPLKQGTKKPFSYVKMGRNNHQINRQ